MTIDFLIGAIRASRDLHPLVQTELEDILHKVEEGEYGKKLSLQRMRTETTWVPRVLHGVQGVENGMEQAKRSDARGKA